jgi:rhomboid family protein
MLLPLYDRNRSKGTAKITMALIAANVAVFGVEMLIGEPLIRLFACYPDKIAELLQFNISRIIYLPGMFTSMFLHGGMLHLLGNMWFLWIFGDNIEHALGSGRFLNFYLAAGALASLSQVIVGTNGNAMIGASGAIAGVLGAYFLLYPKAKVVTLFFFWMVDLPAAIFLGLWLGVQIVYSMITPDAGIAWYAHIGGFAAGFVLVKLFKKKRR